MQVSLMKWGFLECRGDDGRWRGKGCEGGLGALGEIRTPDPRIRSPMLYPAELRARVARTLARQHPKASPGRRVFRGAFQRARSVRSASDICRIRAAAGTSRLPAC